MKSCISIVFTGIFILGGQAISGQSLRYAVSMPYSGLMTYSRQQSDPFSFTGNQAALAGIKNTAVGLFGERRFLLAPLSAYVLAAAIPTYLGHIGIVFNYGGFKNFNEYKIGLAYARKLTSTIEIGVQFNYYSYRIPAYGNAGTINFEMGAIWHLSAKLNGGIQVYNPVGGKIGKKAKEKLASAYKAGLGYDASDHFFIGAEVIKEEDKPVNIIAGMQYHFARQFFARVGISGATGSVYFGAGISMKNWRLDVTGSYHFQLGLSPGILLVTNFKQKER